MKIFFTILLFLLNIFSFAGEIETRECIEHWGLRQVGVREQGYNSGKQIEYFITACGFKPDSKIAYCACTITAGMKYCQVNNLPKYPATAANWFSDRKKVIYIRGVSSNYDWKLGDVFALHGEERIIHAGFVGYVYKDRGYFITFEANTSDSGNIWNPGEGFHAKKRSLKQIYMVANYITSTDNSIAKITYHIVQKKETLYRIAQVYEVTVDELLAWNGISDNIIYLGQKLIVKK